MAEKANIPGKKKKKVFESYTKHALSDIDYKKLIRACNKKEDQLLLQIAVEMGLRRLDVSKILISNIDRVNKKITFHEHKKNRDRSLPMPNALAQEIDMYLQTVPKNQKYLFGWGKSDFGDYTAYRRFNALCRQAGIPERPFHALRGTCYKFKKDAGWSVEQAAYLLGDSVQVAMEHYGAPTDVEIERLVRGVI